MDSATANEPISDVASMAANIAAAVGNAGRMSPTSISSHGTEDDGKARMKSPANMMAEALLLSQQAAMKEADNFAEMLKLKQQEMKLSSMEREYHTKALAKLVERLCPEEDPTDKFLSRKRKLDDSRAFLGEDLYQMKLQQLCDEFVKQSAL